MNVIITKVCVCVLFDTAQLVVWREVGAEDSGEEAVEAVPVRHPR